MEVITLKSEKTGVRKVKKIMESAGNHIGSVWFIKRSNRELRKLAYKLHCKNPTYAQPPSGKNFLKRKAQDSDNMLITVLDVNNVIRAKSGKRKGLISGRGRWVSIPLNNVVRTCIDGNITKYRWPIKSI